MDISINASPAPAAAAAASGEDKKLKKACKDFEAILINQMLTSMRNSVQKTDLFGGSEEEQMFQGMLDQETAQSIADTGSMQIGDMLYRELSQIQKNTKVSDGSVDK